MVLLVLVIVPPSVNAQEEINLAAKAAQKSVTITINEAGDVHATHVVGPSNSVKQVELVDGVIENLVITNEEGEEQLVTVIGNNDGVLVFPINGDSIVEYDLKDVLVLKEDLWTWDFRYLETTSFILPEKSDLIFVNDRPVYLGEKKAIRCHGCQMVLEYAFSEPKNIIKVDWEDKEFLVEMRTFADIENFKFSQPTKRITFDVKDGNQFITTIIPLELLWRPYVIFQGDEKIHFQDAKNNGTHVWINMRPSAEGGEIKIIGTTVVPEFPIIAPMVIGFLMIMMIPLVRKFNLH